MMPGVPWCPPYGGVARSVRLCCACAQVVTNFTRLLGSERQFASCGPQWPLVCLETIALARHSASTPWLCC
jgi:hypothetical protein